MGNEETYPEFVKVRSFNYYIRRTPHRIKKDARVADGNITDLSEKVEDILKTLPEKQRDIIQKRYFNNLTLEQIGKSYGVSKQGTGSSDDGIHQSS